MILHGQLPKVQVRTSGSRWMGNGGLWFTADILAPPLAHPSHRPNNLIIATRFITKSGVTALQPVLQGCANVSLIMTREIRLRRFIHVAQE